MIIKREKLRILFEDFILPFVAGFFGVLLIFWLNQYLTQDAMTRKIIRNKNAPQYHGTGPLKPIHPEEIWTWPDLERDSSETPPVWVVTPTYENPYQLVELTRVAQALHPARNFVHWVVVNDAAKSQPSQEKRQILDGFLRQFGINYFVLNSVRKPTKIKSIRRPKGVEARRTGIALLRNLKLNGTIYFADDDNVKLAHFNSNLCIIRS